MDLENRITKELPPLDYFPLAKGQMFRKKSFKKEIFDIFFKNYFWFFLDILVNNFENGPTNDMLDDLRRDDINPNPNSDDTPISSSFKNFTRISSEDFDKLCNGIAPFVEKQDRYQLSQSYLSKRATRRNIEIFSYRWFIPECDV